MKRVPAVNSQPAKTRRAYRSSERDRQARETRDRIVRAAHSLFVANGYSATTIRAVAQGAGVAEPTVYLVFKNKAALLDAVIDAAIGGPTGTAWREQLDAALTRRPEQLLREFASATASLMERTARILAIADAAAMVEPELHERRKRGHALMRTRFAQLVNVLEEADVLATPSGEYAAATIYALTGEDIFLRLTNGLGWSTADYGRWLGDLLVTTLLRI